MRLLWLCVLVPQCHCSFSGEAPYFKANTTIGRLIISLSTVLATILPGRRVSVLTVMSPQKSYLFPALMTRTETLPSCWACRTQQRGVRGCVCDCSCGIGLGPL
uniref:Secreted protein n=1 Tax=Castor canadensis TaxID=51338 RepID=A0A8C0W8T5_CASCN